MRPDPDQNVHLFTLTFFGLPEYKIQQGADLQKPSIPNSKTEEYIV